MEMFSSFYFLKREMVTERADYRAGAIIYRGHETENSNRAKKCSQETFSGNRELHTS